MNYSVNTLKDENTSHINNDENSSELIKFWYAIYTIVRHEKKVCSALVNKNVETFLPVRDIVNQWKDRKKRVQLPLFPGYVFINIPQNCSRELLHVYNTPGVIRILGNNGQHTPIPSEQINSIRKFLECDLDYDLYSYLSEGKKVVVTKGPMEGVTGKIITRKGRDRLVVSVDLIKRSVGIELEADLVELI
ncbi:MAG: UpxY family transcription antiterminator [Thermodesulfobacteriota bacterium]